MQANQPPRLVVVGVCPEFGRRDPGVRPGVLLALSADLVRLYHQRMRESGEPYSLVHEWALHLPAYRHRGAVIKGARCLRHKKMQNFRLVQGHVAITRSSSPPAEFVSHGAALDFQSLRRLTRYCHEHDIDLILIEPPLTPAYRESVTGREEVIRRLHEIAAEVGAEFISQDIVGGGYLTADDWATLNHLNERGAVKHSTLLAPRVRGALSLTAQRDDGSVVR